MSNKSLDIIHDEHRALAAMLSGLRGLVASIEAGRLKPDFELMASMIEYIEMVPE
ncbi:MAG: hemerythrin domain-containing protein, partial [Rhodocyclaceae bacterium]